MEAALNRMKTGGVKLRPADVEARDEDGKSLAEACLESKMLPLLMKPEHHESPKTCQAVYDALPENGKILFDGRDGRPSFQKMKNALTAEAVRGALLNKSAGRWLPRLPCFFAEDGLQRKYVCCRGNETCLPPVKKK